MEKYIQRMEHLNKYSMAYATASHFRNRFILDWGFSSDQFAEACPLIVRFITRTVGAANGQIALKEFGRFYFDLSAELLGNNLGRKKRWQPLAYAYVDHEGSRTGGGTSSHVPHIHALMMIHPDYVERADHLLDAGKHLGDIRPFNPAEGSLPELATYCMKGVIGRGGFFKDRSLLWDVYPQ